MSERRPFTIGLLGSLTLVGAILIFLWLLTFQDPDYLNTLVTASFFLVGGLSLSFAMVGVRLQPFNFTRFIYTILFTVLNIMVMMYVNQLVPLSLISEENLAVLMGIAEEAFFRLFVCGLIFRMTANPFIAIIVSSVIWSTYHVARYGGNLNVLLVVFLCGCVLGASFIWSQSPDSSIFAHGLVNYIALA